MPILRWYLTFHDSATFAPDPTIFGLADASTFDMAVGRTDDEHAVSQAGVSGTVELPAHIATGLKPAVIRAVSLTDLRVCCGVLAGPLVTAGAERAEGRRVAAGFGGDVSAVAQSV